MSWAEDMGYDAYDLDDFVESVKEYYDETWTELKRDGCIWQDKNFIGYKPQDIKDSHLLNIINFCKRNYRPKEQVEALKQLAKERGLI